MGAGVEISIKLLGPLAIERAGACVALPGSRKVRALIAYLAMAPRPLSRTHLCELLWDAPGDPRGELRWCLSKMRGLLDEPGRRRIESSGERVALDLEGCRVDARDVARAIDSGLSQLAPARLRELAALCAGDFLDALQLDRSPQFDAWLIGQRRRFQACHTAILQQLAHALPAGSDEQCGVLERWLERAPLDRRAYEMLFDALAQRGRVREGEKRLAVARRLFEAEGLDATPLGAAWRASMKRQAAAPGHPSRADANRILQVARESKTSVAVIEPRATATISMPRAGVAAARRASIAVMPLRDITDAADRMSGLAGALIHDVITRLAKLRSVAVIAQGTVFALGERGVSPGEAGRMLDVDYVASGWLRRRHQRVTVMMELAETRSAHIVWAEDFDYALDDALFVLDELGDRIVAAIAGEVEMAERKRALLKPPASLDAWEAYHRGLWHMYRFDAADNERAQHFFQMSLRLDPTFSRAHAGLSFTHFQNAFLHRIGDRRGEAERALETAAQGLIADERDPAAHWAMGRALWLHGRQEECLQALERAVALSPNFALGHYTLAFVHSQSGDPVAAIVSSDHSRQLSPFDPLLFAMMASRAMAHVRLGQFDEAAQWGLSAAGRPNAHVHVQAIAAHCLAAASRLDEARGLIASIHKTHPRYGIEDFLTAFHFDADTAGQFRRYAQRIGIG